MSGSLAPSHAAKANDPVAAPPDLPHDLDPTEADIGSLFPTIERMANRYPFSYSFLGDRRLMMDEDLKYGWDRSKYSLEDAKYLNSVYRSKVSTLVKSLALAGFTWPGLVSWDDMRTVDYLASRVLRLVHQRQKGWPQRDQ